MKKLSGIVGNSGIAIAPAKRILAPQEWFLERLTVPQKKEREIQPDVEFQRIAAAREKITKYLKQLYQTVEKKLNREELEIIEAQTALLEDTQFIETLKKFLQKPLSAEEAILETLAHFEAKFLALRHVRFRQKFTELQDIWYRVLSALYQGGDLSSLELKEPAIIVSKELSPTQFAALNWDLVRGIVTQRGSTTSHLTVLAQALEIPYLFGVSGQEEIRDGQELILDAFGRIVILSPTAEQMEKYRRRQKIWRQEKQRRKTPHRGQTQTACGCQVTLRANVNLSKELELLQYLNVEGIGLFRTEMLFMHRPTLPGEEEQFQFYRDIAKKLHPKPVVFRLLDIGGDKVLNCLQMPTEQNPELGMRGIRFLLSRRELLLTQLKALLKASRWGNVKILIPMLSSFEELLEVREIKSKLERELKIEKYIELGIMIETPASALMIPNLKGYADFLSLGTNDLLQFSMAADRNNHRVNYLLNPLYPQFLKLLELTVNLASEQSLPLAICGNMASDPLIFPLLLGLGLREFSLIPSKIPIIQLFTKKFTVQNARELAQRALQLKRRKEVLQELKNFAREFKLEEIFEEKSLKERGSLDGGERP